jgi:hypothetical protein
MMPPMRQKDAPERRLVALLCGTSSRRQAVATELSALVDEVDVTRLVALLRRLRMLVLLGDRLLSLGVRDMPELERALEEQAAAERGWGVITEFTALDVLDQLTSAGIRALALKGSTLARVLYRDVGARSSIDIDILVAPDDLARAVAVLEQSGWRALPGGLRDGGLPRLHEVLAHQTLPSVELHWRIHWYERRFAADALARARRPAAGASLEMQPLDGLIALMLFYARDGFAGLRFPADVAAWWDLRCAGMTGPSPVDIVAQQYPALTAPVTVASRLLSELVGAPADHAGALPFRWRVAAELAGPFLDGGRHQAEANAGLADLLLAPPAAAGAALRRVLQNAPTGSPPAGATVAGTWGASAGHVVRVARRWALALGPALLRTSAPLSRSGAIGVRPAARPTGRRPRRST